MTVMTIEQLTAKASQEYVSDWIEVTQAMIDKFADATGDHQFIHVDPIAAASSPFGGTIAHGFLTLSLMPRLRELSDMPNVSGVKLGVNYGGNKVRFIAPVRSGKRIRGRFKTIEWVEKRKGQWQQTVEFTIEIEDSEKPALIGEWINQLFL